MIDEETLKKHNLKAVPFSCIGEGQTFYVGRNILSDPQDLPEYERRLSRGVFIWADGYDSPMFSTPNSMRDDTVYVPVWRPTVK